MPPAADAAIAVVIGVDNARRCEGGDGEDEYEDEYGGDGGNEGGPSSAAWSILSFFSDVPPPDPTAPTNLPSSHALLS